MRLFLSSPDPLIYLGSRCDQFKKCGPGWPKLIRNRNTVSKPFMIPRWTPRLTPWSWGSWRNWCPVPTSRSRSGPALRYRLVIFFFYFSSISLLRTFVHVFPCQTSRILIWLILRTDTLYVYLILVFVNSANMYVLFSTLRTRWWDSERDECTLYAQPGRPCIFTVLTCL